VQHYLLSRSYNRKAARLTHIPKKKLQNCLQDDDVDYNGTNGGTVNLYRRTRSRDVSLEFCETRSIRNREVHRGQTEKGRTNTDKIAGLPFQPVATILLGKQLAI
jgi:hypothetical protein